MNKILDLLKVLLDKYLIQVLISIIVTGCIYIKIPIDSDIIKKLSVIGFLSFVFSICLLITILALRLINLILKKIKYVVNRRRKTKAYKEALAKEFRLMANNLSPEDRKILRDFYDTKKTYL